MVASISSAVSVIIAVCLYSSRLRATRDLHLLDLKGLVDRFWAGRWRRDWTPYTGSALFGKFAVAVRKKAVNRQSCRGQDKKGFPRDRRYPRHEKCTEAHAQQRY